MTKWYVLQRNILLENGKLDSLFITAHNAGIIPFNHFHSIKFPLDNYLGSPLVSKNSCTGWGPRSGAEKVTSSKISNNRRTITQCMMVQNLEAGWRMDYVDCDSAVK